jgi:hypothetical protein
MHSGGRPDSHRSPRAGDALAHQHAHDRIVGHRWGADKLRTKARLRASSMEMRGAEGQRARRRRTPLSTRHDDAAGVPDQFAKVLFCLGHLLLLPRGGGWALPPVIWVFRKLVRVAYR